MAIPHLFYKKYKEAIPFSGAPTSLIRNMKEGMPMMSSTIKSSVRVKPRKLSASFIPCSFQGRENPSPSLMDVPLS